MIRNARTKKWVASIAACVALLTASVASAEFIFSNNQWFIDGVDEFGNRTFELGSLGNARVVKDTRTGFICQVVQGIVENESGEKASFVNFGSEVFDPETQEIVGALVDLLRVAPNGRARQFSVAINEIVEEEIE